MAPARETLLDVRGLEPCEPMERILARLGQLEPGVRLRALLSREPVPLFALLEQRGFHWRVERLEPGRCEIVVWKRGDSLAAPEGA